MLYIHEAFAACNAGMQLGVLTLPWYTYIMCLPFGMLFRKIWYSDRWLFIRDEGAQLHTLGVFLANYGKKALNLSKIGSNFQGSGGTFTNNFDESIPSGVFRS